MADNKIWPATGLTGGTDHDLDGYDGNDLTENDGAVVITDDYIYIYTLKADSGSESSPDRIVPDTNPGTFCWHLVDIIDGHLHDGDTLQADGIQSDAVAFVINDAGNNVDFRVESSLSEYAIFVDAGTDWVYLSYGVGIVQVGNQDTVYGQLRLTGHATGSSYGGSLQLYNAADFDTTINLWYIAAFEDDLYIGPDTDSDAIKLTSDKDLYLTDGDIYIQEGGTTKIALKASNHSIEVGVADTEYGSLYLYGHAAASTIGGEIYLYTAADHDTVYQYHSIRVHEDDLYIGNSVTENTLCYTGADSFWNVKSGYLLVGNDDQTTGWLIAAGAGAASTAGGILVLRLAADHDTTINDYRIQGYEDDLYIGSSSDTDIITIIAGSNVDITTSLSISGTGKAAGQLYGGATDPTNTTRLNYDGYFYATRVYNPVYSDFADYTDLAPGEQNLPGCCYVVTKTGARISKKKCEKGTIGIASDLYGMAVGKRKDVDQTPISVGGYVLAFVDKIYDPGTPLTSGPHGILTEMSKRQKRLYPERLAAIYIKKESKRRWGDRPHRVNVWGRHWVKVA